MQPANGHQLHLATQQQYELRKKLGEGAFGQVWKCSAPQPNSPELAVKLVDKDDAVSILPEVQLQQMASELASRAVPRCHEACLAVVVNPQVPQQTAEFFAILMDFVDGKSAKALSDACPFPEAILGSVMYDCLGALKRFHDAGIVHADVKPDNILISRDGVCMFCDFGVSFVADGTARQVAGTPIYMAPEVVKTKAGPDKTVVSQYEMPADIWAFGITLLSLVFGSAPMQELDGPAINNVQYIMQQIKLKQVSLTKSRQNEISIGLEELIYSCLERDASKRATAKQLVRHPAVCHGPSARQQFQQWIQRVSNSS